MVIPHTLIVILLSHLQAVYNNNILTFVIAVGVTVALLQLLQRVGESVESVNCREGVGRGGGSITTPK